MDKGRVFRQLHERPEIFLMPNPWDPGTTKFLASLGFQGTCDQQRRLCVLARTAGWRNNIRRDDAALP